MNWGGAAFDPVNQILYANTSRAVHIVKLIPARGRHGPPPPGHDFGPQQGALFAMTRAVALSPLGLVQQAAMGRDGRGRSGRPGCGIA